MVIFGMFKKSDKSSEMASVVIGYLRTEMSKHIGHPVGSKEYKATSDSATEKVEATLLPILAANKRSQQEVLDMLSPVCGARVQEAYGEYLVLLWTRIAIIQVAIAKGKVKPEEATFEIVMSALSEQLKRFLDSISR